MCWRTYCRGRNCALCELCGGRDVMEEYWGSRKNGPFLVCALKRALLRIFREKYGEGRVSRSLKEIDYRIYGRKQFRWLRRYNVRRPQTEEDILRCVDDMLCPSRESASIPERILHSWYETTDPRTSLVETMYLEDREITVDQWLELLRLDDVRWFSQIEAVHHDNTDCPHGRKIREDPSEYDNWTDGAGERPLCDECQIRGSS